MLLAMYIGADILHAANPDRVTSAQVQAIQFGSGLAFFGVGASASLVNGSRSLSVDSSDTTVTESQAASDTAAGTAQSEIGPSTQLAAPESYCSFSGNTMVATAHGEQPIDSIAVGDQVLAYNQQLGSTDYYTVTATWAHVDPVIVILRLNGEQIETTPDHPFFTLEGGWIAAGS